jgi:hypothetical protein
MAPEQWRGERVGRAADVYALGAVLFELVTGRLVRDPSRPPTAGAPPRAEGISAGLAAVLQRALAHDERERYPSAAAFGAALLALTRPLERATPSGNRTGRRTLRVAGLSTVAAAAAILAAGLGFGRSSAVEAVGAATAALPDLSGRWRSLDGNREVTALQRLSPWVYYWDSSNADQPSAPRHYRNRGLLFAGHRTGAAVPVLEGQLADVPGWCCGNVGATTVQVAGPGALLVAASDWGTSHEFYPFHRRPYWLTRDAPPSERVAEQSALPR